jgi:hypothetical protein
MFVVVTVVAIFLGYHVNWIRQRREFLRDRPLLNPYDSFLMSGKPVTPEAPGLLWLFAERGTNLILIPSDNPNDKQVAQELFPEAVVYLHEK